jgi:hypothetical protein
MSTLAWRSAASAYCFSRSVMHSVIHHCNATCTPSLDYSMFTDPVVIMSWLTNGSTDDSLQIAIEMPASLRLLAARTKFNIRIYQKTSSTYDLPLMCSCVGPMILYVGAANYLSATEVRPTVSWSRCVCQESIQD